MVKRSTLAVSLVVVLVLLSGCSAVLDGSNGDGTGAGTETPDSAEEFDYADGFGPNGITDSQQALESYQSAVEARGSYASTHGFDVRLVAFERLLTVGNAVRAEPVGVVELLGTVRRLGPGAGPVAAAAIEDRRTARKQDENDDERHRQRRAFHHTEPWRRAG